ncbi:MAG: glycoside hydrolase family 9 protein [Alistipes senegalensis]|nr:glycoside hydrolase family 9 protein [Alistipes senegalensis]
MHKKNMNKIKSAVVSSVLAVSAIATPLSAVVMNASAADDNYAKLLQYSMYFYDANMCGKQVGETSAMSWRDDCHTSDEVDGGFHDAGDHVKFGLPAGYSASTLGWSYYEFKDAYDATGQGNHLKTLTDYFATFFKNSTTLSGDTVTNFVYQIGNGYADHEVWCAPEVHKDNSRQTFSTTSGASDIAAEYAAALAVNYVNFGNAEDLKYAKALFDFSIKGNQCATEGIDDFYRSRDYYDDQAWAAGWLYKATNDNSYKEFLNKYMTSASGGASGDGCMYGIYSTHSWNNVSMGAGILQAEITGDSADWKKVTEYLNGHGAGSDSYYFENQWGSARYNTAQQMAALVATKYGAASYNDWAKGQMDYIMGNKGVGSASPVCFVVGFASNSAKNPHHRAASGYSSFDELGENTQSSPNGHTLIGALVGGPTDANGSYVDSVKDYTANEVTIDYNATLVGAAAGLYSVYKTGSVESSIEGVGNVSSGNPNVTSPVQTNATTQPIVTTVTTTNNNNNNSSSGHYSITPNKSIAFDKNAEDKMVGFEWSQFNIPSTEKVTKVEVKISSKNGGEVGKWNGAFGTSTSVSPEYWAQGDDMEQTISGNSGTITWNVPSNIADVAQFQYGGEVKFGTWWVDCQDFVIDEINVYTNAYSGSSNTTANSNQGNNNNNTTTTTAQPSTSAGNYEIKPNKTVNYDKNSDDKMVGFEWSQFNIPATEKVKKVEVTISSKNGGEVGKWQGAFGTSTSVSPEYWAQGDDMEQVISGNKGTITWNVPSNIADIAQFQYGGEVKFGTWWVDCQDFVIESIKVYTDGTAQTTTTTTTTQTTTTTTKAPITSNLLLGDANGDGKVSVADAVLIMQSLSNPTAYQLTAEQAVAADVVNKGDGVTTMDALAIQMLDIGLLNLSDLPISSDDLQNRF